MRLLFAFLFISLLGAAAEAQLVKAVAEDVRSSEKMVKQLAKAVAEDVRSSEKVVKGAPFTADAITESVQILSDGNRIIRSSTSKLYRDSEGRYRRDDNRKQLGVPGANVEMPESIVIIDPIAGTKYTLNQKERTFNETTFGNSKFQKMFERAESLEKRSKQQNERAEKRLESASKQIEKQIESAIKRSEKRFESETGRDVDQELRRIEKPKPEEPPGNAKPGPVTTKESLGTRVIEGVQAEGTRMTTVIPAGIIGNEREISVVYEKWYSNELMMTVQSIHNDPRFGEQKYRLTNISRTEPPASVFAPPADYTKASGKKPPAGPKAPSINIKAPNISVKPSPPSDPKPKKMTLLSDGNKFTLLR